VIVDRAHHSGVDEARRRAVGRSMAPTRVTTGERLRVRCLRTVEPATMVGDLSADGSNGAAGIGVGPLLLAVEHRVELLDQRHCADHRVLLVAMLAQRRCPAA